jgi:hypothetical protein
MLPVQAAFAFIEANASIGNAAKTARCILWLMRV